VELPFGLRLYENGTMFRVGEKDKTKAQKKIESKARPAASPILPYTEMVTIPSPKKKVSSGEPPAEVAYFSDFAQLCLLVIAHPEQFFDILA
jgi:hypothetical protein